MLPDGWVAKPLPGELPVDCSWFDPWGGDYRVLVWAGEIQITREPNQRPVPIPKGLEARMELEFGRVPELMYVFEYPQGWLALSNQGEFGGGRFEWWDRTLSSGQSITIGDGERAQDVIRATASGDVVFVLQSLWHHVNTGQLAELRREHDHFTSRVIARYDRAPTDMLPQPDGSWLVLTENAVWHTLPTGTVELMARLPPVPQNETTLAVDDAGRLYAGGRLGVMRLTPSWGTTLRYIPDLLLPKGFSFERCASARRPYYY
jgi:hypothetical protein